MKYTILVLILIFPIFSLAQNIPNIPAPQFCNPQITLSKVQDNQIQNYKYVWYLIFPEWVIKFARENGVNQPKEFGPLTEQTCIAAIQANKLEGINAGYSKRLNPLYRPATNKETGQDDEPLNSYAGEYTYDPTDDAIKRMNQEQKKTAINDPNVVDLSGLKDPYSAKVDLSKLKDPKQSNIPKEKCQEAIDYADNRITTLNRLISNSGNLIAQQQKSLETSQNEVNDWAKLVSDNNIDFAKNLDNVAVELLSNVVGEESNYKNWGTNYGYFTNASDALSLVMDAPKEHFFSRTLPKAVLLGLNTVDMNFWQNEAIKKSPYKYIHYTLVCAPAFTDILLVEAYRIELQDANKDLESNKLNADLLNLKIESWKNELRELNDCGTNCSLIRDVMIRYRPDLE